MSNKLKEIDIKICTQYFFDDTISFLDPNKIKIKMSSKLKETDIQNHTKYLFDDMINILDPNKIKIDENHTKIFLFTTLDTSRSKTDLTYATTNSVNPLYLIINNTNECIEDGNGNKCLTLVSTDESKNTLKNYGELWNKIRDLFR